MASSGSIGDTESAHTPHDDILDAIKEISAITNKKGNKLTKSDANNIQPHLATIKNGYLVLLDKIKELESIKESHLKCSQPPNPHTRGSQMTYSAAVSGPTKPRFDPLTTLQVYPKSQAESGESTLLDANATKEFLQRVDLTGKGIRVKDIKTISRKGVSVICFGKDDAEKLCTLLNSEKGDTVQAKTPIKRDPAFTFFLKGKGHDLTQLKSTIEDRNSSLKEPGAFSLVHKYETRNGNTIVIMKVKPSTYETLKQDNFYLYLDWTRVILREQDPITQCFKCQRYGHKASKCQYTVDGNLSTRCVRCSHHHHTNEPKCTAELCCVNCSEYNDLAIKRKWKQVDTKHAANDQECPARIKAINRARSLINYV